MLAQIQQFAFPKLTLAHNFLRCRRRCPGNGNTEIPWSFCNIRLLQILNLYPVFSAVFHAGRDRLNTTESGQADINGKPELIIPCKIPEFRCFLCILKTELSAGTHCSTLDKCHFIGAVVDALYEFIRIVNNNIAGLQFIDASFSQPDTCKNMSFHHDKQRMKAHRFKAGRVKQRHIHTSAKTLFKNCFRCTDPLSRDRKTCGWFRINNVLFLNGSIRCGSEIPYAVGITALISFQGRLLAPFLKPL